VLGLSLFVLATPCRGFAQDAQGEFDRGMTAFNAGRYEAAVDAFNSAYRIKQTALVLYQLGLAYNGMGQPSKALESFESFVRYGDPQKEAAQLSAAKSEIARIKSSVGRFAVKVSPTSAVIQIDGHAAAITNNEIWMLPGRHTIEIRADGYESYSQTLDVQSGRYSLEINLRRPIGAPGVVAAGLVDEGMTLKVQGDNLGAYAKFQEAENVSSTPRGLAQMGLVEEALGDLASAEDHITAALAARKDPWIRKNRGQLRTAQKRIMRVTKNYAKLEISGPHSGAQVTVNDRPVGTLPLGKPVRVPAGHVRVIARLQGFVDYAYDADLPRRSLKPVVITMDPLPPPPPPPPPPPKPEPEPPPPPLPVVEQKPEPPPDNASQADIEALLREQGQLPEDNPRATGFELGVNFGYLLWFEEGPFGSKGGPSMQLALGARVPWFLSFGLELFGLSADFERGSTNFIMTLHPSIYVRAHSQRERKALTFDVWGGAGFAPFAMAVASFESGTTEAERVAQSGTAAAQRKAIMQRLGVGDFATLQTINLPLQLGATFFITRGVGIDLSLAFTFWFPIQLCYHDGKDSYCVDKGLDGMHSLFIGGGLQFLP
jgi:tetratricopeptide (TPR) repeat protein